MGVPRGLWMLCMHVLLLSLIQSTLGFAPRHNLAKTSCVKVIKRPQKKIRTVQSLNSLIDPSSLISAIGSNCDVATAFNIATFLPQPFWVLLIALPNSKFTRHVMSPLYTLILFSLVHFFIVVISATQDNGTAPLAEFAGVFDPQGQPLKAMQGMMQYPNFVSEEWSHVLTWDLFVGRWIWLDGLKRNIFTPHSVLLTNLIGPPGFLLHVITCFLSGKGLPVPDLDDSVGNSGSSSSESNTNSVSPAVPTIRADMLIENIFPALYAQRGSDSVQQLLNNCADDVEWEDTADAKATVGKRAVQQKWQQRLKNVPQNTRLVLDKIADGERSSGFTYHFEVDGKEGKGLRGTTFVMLNADGKICYVREVVEPLFKPGGAIVNLLKAVAERNLREQSAATTTPTVAATTSNTSKGFTKRTPVNASDLVQYLWYEVQTIPDSNARFDVTLQQFADNVFYEDFNFPEPLRGVKQVEEFLREFDIPGITFKPERISEGTSRCCFTWRVEIAGVEASTRGVSFYEIDSNQQLIYVRDIPEPAIKPPPLQTLASALQPAYRKFDVSK